MELTQEQLTTNAITQEHIRMVASNIHTVVSNLLSRADHHDASKLVPPEVEIFTEFTPRLKTLTYDSVEYRACLAEMQVALTHHYANNPHHPEHHKAGVEDMTLIDLVEMLCDWMAACKRHHDGNILKSIEANGNRFSLSPQLVKILENTAKALER